MSMTAFPALLYPARILPYRLHSRWPSIIRNTCWRRRSVRSFILFRNWTIADRTVHSWLNEAVELARADVVAVPPHTFRHSYAMHMLYAGIPLKVLQSLMGHRSTSSTEVYTKVFALDVAARHRVQFQMPAADAVAMLKNNNR